MNSYYNALKINSDLFCLFPGIVHLATHCISSYLEESSLWPNIFQASFLNLKPSKAENNSILSLLYLWLLEQRSNAEIKLNWF